MFKTSNRTFHSKELKKNPSKSNNSSEWEEEIKKEQKLVKYKTETVGSQSKALAKQASRALRTDLKVHTSQALVQLQGKSEVLGQRQHLPFSQSIWQTEPGSDTAIHLS